MNAPGLMELRGDLGQPGLDLSVYYWSHLLLQGHFFPIFSLLFGVSFALVMAGAQKRGQSPAPVFLRRLGLLAILGLLHHQLQPGEVLLPYAVFGLLLLPFNFLPTAVIIGASALICVLAFWITPILLTPAMFLLGLALHRQGLFEHGAPLRPVLARWFPWLAVLTVCLTVVQAQWRAAMEPPIAVIAGFSFDLTSVTGLVGAGAIACGVGLLVLRGSTLPGWLRPVAQLGQMSLSSYIFQTLVFIAVAALGWRGGAYILIVPACLLVYAVNFAFSHWWLSRFSVGPLEYLLRWGTTLRRPELQRSG